MFLADPEVKWRRQRFDDHPFEEHSDKSIARAEIASRYAVEVPQSVISRR